MQNYMCTESQINFYVRNTLFNYRSIMSDFFKTHEKPMEIGDRRGAGCAKGIMLVTAEGEIGAGHDVKGISVNLEDIAILVLDE